MVLLEPLLRRATFLEEVVADLELTGGDRGAGAGPRTTPADRTL